MCFFSYCFDDGTLLFLLLFIKELYSSIEYNHHITKDNFGKYINKKIQKISILLHIEELRCCIGNNLPLLLAYKVNTLQIRGGHLI